MAPDPTLDSAPETGWGNIPTVFEDIPPGGNVTYGGERATNTSLVPDREKEATKATLPHVHQHYLPHVP